MITAILSLVLATPNVYFHKPNQGYNSGRSHNAGRSRNLRRRHNSGRRQRAGQSQKAENQRAAVTIVRYLKRQRPEVLQAVMKYMGWEFKRKRRGINSQQNARDNLDDINRWELDQLCKMAGIDCDHREAK